MKIHWAAARALVVAAAVVLLGLAVAAMLLRPGLQAPPDYTRAPEGLKGLCRVSAEQWRGWSYIVVHHSAGSSGDLASIDRWHRLGRHWESAGYHFVIGNGSLTPDGLIEAAPRWDDQQDGAHTRGLNHQAIGICVIGNFDVDHHVPSPRQMESLAQLTAYLMLRYHIPPRHVLLHRNAPNAHTACPGRYFPVEQFGARVSHYLAAYRPLAAR